MRIKGLHSQMCFTQFPIQSLNSSLKKKKNKKIAFNVYILNVNLLKKKKGLSHVAFLSSMEI